MSCRASLGGLRCSQGFRSRPGSYRRCLSSVSAVTRPLASSRLSRGPLSSGLASWESISKSPHLLGVPRVGVLPPYGQLLLSGFSRRDPASNWLSLQQFNLPLSPIPRSRRHQHAETPGLPMGPSRLPECLDPHLQAVTGLRSWTSDT
ncbi:hypothetical protein HPB47_003074 [Ixodes persulcatus]|uniref:Uncharacterized protein n=1 Tax=Ixodes persulcatus TaxID=34615 RepID=A0AC60PJF4_IXOPE|nr:hypothetical protein HPB47_003074 [Ixodes persulcatus]